MKTHEYEIIIDKAILELSRSVQEQFFGCSFGYARAWNGDAFREPNVTAAKDFVRCP